MSLNPGDPRLWFLSFPFILMLLENSIANAKLGFILSFLICNKSPMNVN